VNISSAARKGMPREKKMRSQMGGKSLSVLKLRYLEKNNKKGRDRKIFRASSEEID